MVFGLVFWQQSYSVNHSFLKVNSGNMHDSYGMPYCHFIVSAVYIEPAHENEGGRGRRVLG